MDADIKRVEKRLEYLSSDEKAIEIAKNLLVMSMDIESVWKTTGLSIEEVKSLKH